MNNIVIILAELEDIHAVTVAAEVGATYGGHPLILDTAQYPNNWTLTLAVSAQAGSNWVIRTRDGEVRSEELAGVWWRRPSAHQIAKEVTDEKVRAFCMDEAKSTFLGWIHGLGHRVINTFSAESAANQKPFQLLKAKEVGLEVPSTVITNDPEDALSFLDDHNEQVVFKVLTGPSWQFAETRQFKKEYLDDLKNLRYAPAIFQEIIEAKLDIRVTIVDDRVFAASVNPKHPGAQLDWRLDLAAEIELHVLPKEIEVALIDFLRMLDLRFGVIDLRLTPQGNYVFLEVNPSGQFLFCEIHAGLPISRELAASLLQIPKE